VAHRGTLVHVDRRLDTHVFGPSIDTLVLAEVLAQEVFESNDWTFETAIEVGCGNGLLTAALANNAKGLRELFALDMSFNAVACTARNVSSTRRFFSKGHAEIYYVAGKFKPNMFSRHFDLIVCNPPYIPIPDNLELSGELASDYSHAVGGTALAKELLQQSPRLLSDNGRLLIMASDLSLSDFLAYIPDHVSVRRPLGDAGFEVLFDVEAVFNKSDWLSYLINERGLLCKNGSYYHRLHPLWIEPQRKLFS
jgi:methylase of polypeptide subunit release factors